MAVNQQQQDLTVSLIGEPKKEITNSHDHLNSVCLIKGDFIQRLPEKVKCGIDPEDLVNFDLSAAKGLLQGTNNSSSFLN